MAQPGRAGAEPRLRVTELRCYRVGTVCPSHTLRDTIVSVNIEGFVGLVVLVKSLAQNTPIHPSNPIPEGSTLALRNLWTRILRISYGKGGTRRPRHFIRRPHFLVQAFSDYAVRHGDSCDRKKNKCQLSASE